MAEALLAVKELIRISSNESRICPLCDFELDGVHKFEDCCTHLLQDHNFKCVHVGQETYGLGEPYHCTVAVFVK